MITYTSKNIEKCQLPNKDVLVYIFFVDDIDKLLGKNLRRIREMKGISQEKLAEMINTPATRLSAYETGREGMGKDIMMRICKSLNVRPYEFYIENDTPIPATDLERKALYTAREAEKIGAGNIAEEAIEYTAHRLQVIKKQKKDGIGKSKPTRYKTGSG